MKKSHIDFLSLSLLCVCFPLAVQAEPAGRVLVAVGNVAVVRGGQVIPLAGGSTIESGDQIRTGAASNTQIRFTDSAIVSIKPLTEFAVTEYAFHGRDDGSERAVFNLIRGGFRTVTGLIGRLNKSNYEVRTPTSTIGIRGTVWGAHHCVANECAQSDGSTAKPGTYGEVKAGAINARNESGDSEFGANTSFYVADSTSPAVRLLTTPSFVLDRLTGRSQNAGSRGSDTGAVNLASSGDGRATPILDSPQPVPFVASNSSNPNGSSVVAPSLSNITGFLATYTVGSGGAFDSISGCNNRFGL